MKRLFRWQTLATPAVACAWVVILGCGESVDLPPTAPVAGTLAFEGKPVARGSIHFHPQKGQTANGVVEDGRFILSTYKEGDGAVVGKHRVAIEVVEEVPTKDGDTTSKSLIPQKYTEPDSSGIELEVPAKGLTNLQIDVLKSSVKVKEE